MKKAIILSVSTLMTFAANANTPLLHYSADAAHRYWNVFAAGVWGIKEAAYYFIKHGNVI